MTTQHDKTLAIAKAMFGGNAIEQYEPLLVRKYDDSVTIHEFNPFTDADDSQAVQEYFKLNTHRFSSTWEVSMVSSSVFAACKNKDLKTAIAETAYQIVMSEVG